MKLHLTTLSLLSIVNGQFELTKTFNGIKTSSVAAGLKGSFSCEWDSSNEQWLLNHQKAGDEGAISNIASYDGVDTLTDLNTADPLNALGAQNVAMQFVPADWLYIASSSGQIREYIPYEGSGYSRDIDIATTSSMANGICGDIDGNKLYFTNTAAADSGLYSMDAINTETNPVKVSDLMTDLDEPNTFYSDVSGAKRVGHPNGCVVKDGKVYMVDSRVDGLGGLGIYDIAEGTYTLDTDVLSVSADGIVAVDDWLIVSAMSHGALLYYNVAQYDLGGAFSVGLTGLDSPADIGINPDGVICAPSYEGGEVYLVQFTAPAALLVTNTGLGINRDQGPPAQPGSESCEWDSTQSVWILNNPSDAVGAGNLVTSTLEADDTAPTYNNETDWTGSDGLNLGLDFVAGKDGAADILYIAHFTGEIRRYDATNDEYLTAYTTTSSLANGICYDDVNDDIYFTNTGFNFATGASTDTAALYKVAAVTGNDSPTITKIDLPTTLTETNANYVKQTDGNRFFRPNGCVVREGVVYMVEFRTDELGSFGMYNIADETFEVNGDILTVAADGIVFSGNYVIITANLRGQIMYYDIDNYPNGEFKVAFDGVVSGADIDINADGVICVPSYNAGAISGTVWTFQWTNPTELMFTSSPTTAPPTEAATPVPTMASSAVMNQISIFLVVLFSAFFF